MTARRRQILERLDALLFHLRAGDEDAWTRVFHPVPADFCNVESALAWALLGDREPREFVTFEWSRADAAGFALWHSNKARTCPAPKPAAHQIPIGLETLCRLGDAIDSAELLTGAFGWTGAETPDLVAWLVGDPDVIGRLAGKVGE